MGADLRSIDNAEIVFRACSRQNAGAARSPEPQPLQVNESFDVSEIIENPKQVRLVRVDASVEGGTNTVPCTS